VSVWQRTCRKPVPSGDASTVRYRCCAARPRLQVVRRSIWLRLQFCTPFTAIKLPVDKQHHRVQQELTYETAVMSAHSKSSTGVDPYPPLPADQEATDDEFDMIGSPGLYSQASSICSASSRGVAAAGGGDEHRTTPSTTGGSEGRVKHQGDHRNNCAAQGTSQLL
jgi:hypothetical protein